MNPATSEKAVTARGGSMESSADICRRCRLCESQRLVTRNAIRDVCVQRCESCGFVQVRDRPTPEELAAFYAPPYFNHGKYTDTFALGKENDRRRTLLRRGGVAPGARVLDAGCATGDFMAHVGDAYDLWGLDISEFAVEQARRKNPKFAAQIRAGLLEDQDYEEGFFDAVVMWDVLEHLWDPVATCAKLVSFLKPGGRLFLSTPNIGSLPGRLLGRYWAFMTVPEHLGFFSRRTMSLLLQERLGLEMRSWQSRGKWANVGFLFYKVKRIVPWAVPRAVIDFWRLPGLRRLALYVPTGDIQYVAARKPE